MQVRWTPDALASKRPQSRFGLTNSQALPLIVFAREGVGRGAFAV